MSKSLAEYLLTLADEVESGIVDVSTRAAELRKLAEDVAARDEARIEAAASHATLREAAANLLPYLNFILGLEGSAYPATMPSAVDALKSALDGTSSKHARQIAVALDDLERLRIIVSGGLCYFAVDAKHAQLRDAEKAITKLISGERLSKAA